MTDVRGPANVRSPHQHPLQKYKRINMHWCDYCQVWMANNSVTIATHDRGTKHQAAVARSTCCGILQTI